MVANQVLYSRVFLRCELCISSCTGAEYPYAIIVISVRLCVCLSVFPCRMTLRLLAVDAASYPPPQHFPSRTAYEIAISLAEHDSDAETQKLALELLGKVPLKATLPCPTRACKHPQTHANAHLRAAHSMLTPLHICLAC